MHSGVLAWFLAAAATAAAVPLSYDQRQDGDLNMRADVQNVVLILALPSKMSNLLSSFMRHNRPAKHNQLQERADIHTMEAFVEPNTPYRVEIGSEGLEGDGRAVDVVIAGRRNFDPDSLDSLDPETQRDEMKLLGAREQCGPDRERDPVTLTCRPRAEAVVSTASPAVNPEPSKLDTEQEAASSSPKVQPEVIST